MTELQELRRVTVYSDSSLEQQLIEHFLKMGARGYTAVDCRGKGKHEIVDDPFSHSSRVRIEVLVPVDLAGKFMDYLGQDFFRRRAVLACVETVFAPTSEKF